MFFYDEVIPVAKILARHQSPYLHISLSSRQSVVAYLDKNDLVWSQKAQNFLLDLIVMSTSINFFQ